MSVDVLRELASTNPRAATLLGARYSTTVGTGERCDDEAMRWYKVGAQGGDSKAMHNYGVLLQRRGDQAAAVEWFTKAGDEPCALHALGRLYHTGFHASNGRFHRDLTKAEECYQRASHFGWGPARDDLCTLHLDNRILFGDHSPQCS